MKSAPAGTAAANAANAQTGQPSSRPSTVGIITRARTREASPTPARSSFRAVCERDSGTRGPRCEQRDDADRDIDQEDRAPAEAEDVEGDQPAADDLAGDRGEALDESLDAEGAGVAGRRRTRPG